MGGQSFKCPLCDLWKLDRSALRDHLKGQHCVQSHFDVVGVGALTRIVRVTHTGRKRDMTKGRYYVKFSEVALGDMLIPDGGFDCMEEGKPLEVKQDHDGALYVDCAGPECELPPVQRHFLSGQEDAHGCLIGFHRPE